MITGIEIWFFWGINVMWFLLVFASNFNGYKTGWNARREYELTQEEEE